MPSRPVLTGPFMEQLRADSWPKTRSAAHCSCPLLHSCAQAQQGSGLGPTSSSTLTRLSHQLALSPNLASPVRHAPLISLSPTSIPPLLPPSSACYQHRTQRSIQSNPSIPAVEHQGASIVFDVLFVWYFNLVFQFTFSRAVSQPATPLLETLHS